MIQLHLQKKYFQRAVFWAKILGRLPGVRAIFLSGSLARGDGNKNSDIDFFVIARHGQIWTARFFVFIVLKIFHRLAKPHHHAGQICPNHFITDSSLEMVEQDTYAARLFSANQPLYDPKCVWPSFVKNNESWVRRLGYSFVSFSPDKSPKKSSVENHITDSGQARMTNEKKLHWFERHFETLIRDLQIKKIKSSPDFTRPGAKIILTDKELRFHPEPKNLVK